MIYFLQDSRTYSIKIGFTDAPDAEARVAALQTGNSSELVLLTSFNGGREKESELHRRFAAHRIAGEWFHPAPELVKFIILEVVTLMALVVNDRCIAEYREGYDVGLRSGFNLGYSADKEELEHEPTNEEMAK